MSSPVNLEITGEREGKRSELYRRIDKGWSTKGITNVKGEDENWKVRN